MSAKFNLIALALMCAVFLGACERHVFNAHGPEEAAWNGIKESSFFAAESLIVDGERKLRPGSKVLVGTISSVDNVEESSALGRLISEQISTAFSEDGYVVQDARLRESLRIVEGDNKPEEAGEFPLSRDVRDLASAVNAGALVTGTYAVAKERVHFNIRMIHPVSGEILAAHGYSLVRSEDVNALLGEDKKKPYKFFSGSWL